MTYADISALALDGAFYQREQAAVAEQAGIYTADGRPDIKALADAVLADIGKVFWFQWPIATQPGFAAAFAGGGQESITDAQMLSAVQTVWPTVASVHADELGVGA